MDGISGLLSERRRYVTLRNNVNQIIQKLNVAITNLDIPGDQIKNLYNIDYISIDKGNINKIRENLTTRRNNLKTTILNQINREIRRIDDLIEGME